MSEPPSNSALRPWRLTLVLDGFNPRARDSNEPAFLAAALAARGHQVERLEVHGGVWAREPRSAWSGSSEAPSPEAERLTSGLVETAPEALVAYDGSSPAAWIAARAAARLDVPLLILEPGWNDLRRLRERMLESFGRRLWGRVVRQRTRGVLAFDPLALEQTLERGFNRELVELCPGGVERSIFRPGQPTRLISKYRLSGRLLLAVGPFEAKRGQELLIRAFAASVGQREDWSLVLVGSGSAEDRLVTVATRLGVAGRVRLIGYPSPEELAGLLGAGTLFAMPAENERPRGVQVARALACGLPVLTADFPRYRFRFTPGREGLVLPPGDLPAWTEALGELARSPDRRQQMAAAARELGSSLGWERVAQQVEAQLERAGAGRLSVRAG